MSETISTWLRRRARPPVLPRRSHRESLERELAARFGTARKERAVITVLFRAGIAAGLLAAVGAGASQVPATYQAEVGKRIEIRATDAPSPDAIHDAVAAIESGAQAGRREIRVKVRVTREGEGTLVRLDAFGDTIGMEGIPDAIRAAVPSLAGARITVEPVEGEVEGDLGGLVGNRVLGERLTDAQVEAAVRVIEAEVKRDLAAEGVAGDVQVDVKADDSGGQVRREVRVIVKKEREAGAQ